MCQGESDRTEALGVQVQACLFLRVPLVVGAGVVWIDQRTQCERKGERSLLNAVHATLVCLFVGAKFSLQNVICSPFIQRQLSQPSQLL